MTKEASFKIIANLRDTIASLRKEKEVLEVRLRDWKEESNHWKKRFEETAATGILGTQVLDAFWLLLRRLNAYGKIIFTAEERHAMRELTARFKENRKAASVLSKYKKLESKRPTRRAKAIPFPEQLKTRREVELMHEDAWNKALVKQMDKAVTKKRV